MKLKFKLFCAGMLIAPTIALAEVDAEVPTGEGAYYSESEISRIDEATRVRQADELAKTETTCDGSGRVQRIDYPSGGFKEYFYHPKYNKIRAVVTNDGSAVFSYNKAGELSRIYNTDGQLITLDYDKHKHISRMIETNQIEHTRRELTFKYDAKGHPTNIRMVGKGEIKVKYNKRGEIAKVDSKQGAAMALSVTEAFQTLMKTVRVADAKHAL